MRPIQLAIAVLSALCCLPLAAQQDGDLQAIQAAFDRRREAAAEAAGGRLDLEKHTELLRELAGQVRALVERGPRGDDRFNAVLMLTDILMQLGDHDAAKEALRKLPVDDIPPSPVLTGASMAGFLGMGELRARWIDAALAKEASFEEKVAAAMQLVTFLEEPERGYAILDRMLAEAEDDEARAKVLWFRAEVLREQEDRTEESFAEALAELAAKYPDTHFGSIAADRLKATRLRPGDEPIAMRTADAGGRPLDLAAFRGKVVVLHFWAAWSRDCVRSLELLRELREQYAGDDLAMVGVSLDEEREIFEKTVKRERVTWPQVFDGRGWHAEWALRWEVEAVPVVHVIDRDGKLAAMNLFPGDKPGERALRDAVSTAIAGGGGR